VAQSIEQCTTWTELFHSLVHDTFKDDGLIIFNSHLTEARQLEVPILNKMFEKHKEIYQAFKTGQASSLKTVNQSPTIRSEEHTSELQSRFDLVCLLLLEKNKQNL